MTTRTSVRELDSIPVDATRLSELREAATRISALLQPSHQQFSESNGSAKFQNLVGSFTLSSGDVVEVAPKVGSADWTRAVIDLLTDETRLAITASQHSRPANRKDDLAAAIALEYSRRLERALRRVGPMVVYERQREATRRWRGRLLVGQWVRSAITDPTRFPMSHDELSVRNDFTRGMSVVAGMLSRSASGETVPRLRRLQGAVIPGSPIPDFVNRSIAHRRMPPQWGVYAHAWDIASAILRNQSIVGGSGRSFGLEVAVEPWRLLETQLERALVAVASARDDLTVGAKRRHPLLVEERIGASSADERRWVEPDGLLRRRDGTVAATFEAKYVRSMDREHVFQAIATAAALSSPVAVLVFPWSEEARRFNVAGFHGHPRHLMSVGVDLFAYRRGSSDRNLASRLIALIEHQAVA